MQKIKVLVSDVDGMLLLGERFSDLFPEKYGVNKDLVEKMFKEHFYDCQLGQKDLRIVLESSLDDWGVNISVDDILKFWFGIDQENTEVIEFLKKMRNKGVKIVLGTNQEKYRLEHILNARGFGDWVDGVVASCEIGVRKPDPKFYDVVLDKFSVSKDEVLIFDDKPDTIEFLRDQGFNAEVFSGLDNLKKFFEDKYLVGRA